jgi:hypothetical protein
MSNQPHPNKERHPSINGRWSVVQPARSRAAVPGGAGNSGHLGSADQGQSLDPSAQGTGQHTPIPLVRLAEQPPVRPRRDDAARQSSQRPTEQTVGPTWSLRMLLNVHVVVTEVLVSSAVYQKLHAEDPQAATTGLRARDR